MNYIYMAHKCSMYHMINFLFIITVFLSVIICTNPDPSLDPDPPINKEIFLKTLIQLFSDFFFED